MLRTKHTKDPRNAEADSWQPSLFNQSTAKRVEVNRAAAFAARDAGMQVAEAGAGDEWNAQALAAVRKVCETRAEFIVDAVWEYVEKPKEGRAMGPVMMRAAKLGWCENTRISRSGAQVKSHGNPRWIWRSLIYQSAANRN